MNKNVVKCMLAHNIFNFSILIVIIAFYCHPLQCKPLDVNNKHRVDNDTKIDDEYNGNLDKKTIEHLRNCDIDLETMELCMRCAKITRSTTVYPLCCGNEDKIKDWCHDYVFYGAL